MKYTFTINQKQAIELGLTNINQTIILGLIADSHTWAETEIIDGTVYYWTARQKIANELPLLNLKPDSIYRHLKSLADLGLIDYIKSGKKDCVKLTKLGKSYYVGNKSELDTNSEINPTKLGNKSEKHSEMNPTYKNTNTIRATRDKSKKINKKEFSFSLKKETAYSNLSEEYKHNLKAKCLLTDGNIDRYENFILSLEAKNYKYIDFSKAYMAWDKDRAYKNYTPVQENALGADWYRVDLAYNEIVAINSKTYEMKKGTKQIQNSNPLVISGLDDPTNPLVQKMLRAKGL